ncbi:hypothetical protein Bca52824_014997 [Brassica carinata]|uniref:Uncharacterized protein n=1 Tax=Brassica carinata TaxID=52824 RepID=A0A8X7W250_BRACI|nr:hypothetical protein Bca52824_014997 [Brassica carinata]
METEFNLSSCTERQHSNDRPWPDEVLMGTISLLRTKEKSSIGLPPKTDGTCYVDLSPEERQLYDHMEGEAKDSFVTMFLYALRKIFDHFNIYRRACILQTLQRTKPSCPLCRGSLTQSDLFNAPPPPSDSQDNDEGDTKPSTKSSKVTALLSLLIASKQENPNTKSVVFSQFRKMLLLLEVPLRAAGFTVSRLDGGMTEETDASHWRLWETGVNQTCGVACQPNVRNF